MAGSEARSCILAARWPGVPSAGAKWWRGFNVLGILVGFSGSVASSACAREGAGEQWELGAAAARRISCGGEEW
jgi:hypothetical protein